jgi:hypothetical protein
VDIAANLRREEMENCRTCRFYESNTASSGECRRLPPTFVGLVSGLTQWPPLTGMWPITNPDDWCGEYANKP